MIRACCEWLRNMMDTAGEQGLGVIASRDDQYRRFEVQARAFTAAQAQAWEAFMIHPAADALPPMLLKDENGRAVPVAMVMSFPLSHCPRCGADLEALVQQQPDAFDRLSDAQKHLR